MSFEIASSNNSLGFPQKFRTIDEFVSFYKKFIMEKLDLVNLPLKIGSQRLSNLLRYRILNLRNINTLFQPWEKLANFKMNSRFIASIQTV